jgi:hypothetical protein
MSAKETGRLPVRTSEVTRLVWYEDGDAVVPDGRFGWVPAEDCEVSNGAWVLSVRLLDPDQHASCAKHEGTLEQDLAALRIGFVDFEVYGAEPHRTNRRERLRQFKAEASASRGIIYNLGTWIRVRSQGADPNELFAELFRDAVEPKAKQPEKDTD